VTSTEGTGAFEWRTAPGKPGHASTTFHAMGNEATTGTSSLLTSAEPVAIPASGATTLEFVDWSYNHGGDKNVVEVSEDGETWTQVYLGNTPNDLAAETRFATDQMASRRADLTPFAGRSVYLRFRFTQGPELYIDVTRFGWYVDDIAVTHIEWTELATTSESSFEVSGRGPGTYLYRVRTTYGTIPSRFGDPVTARVA
jgi:hypothetical protein